MENDLIFEDIYEPIKFKMVNVKKEEFECQTQFRSIENNIELEELTKIEYDEKGHIKYDENQKSINKKNLRMMTIMCGQSEEFWGQFSNDAIIKVINKIRDLEQEKYKKKADLK